MTSLPNGRLSERIHRHRILVLSKLIRSFGLEGQSICGGKPACRVDQNISVLRFNSNMPVSRTISKQICVTVHHRQTKIELSAVRHSRALFVMPNLKRCPNAGGQRNRLKPILDINIQRGRPTEVLKSTFEIDTPDQIRKNRNFALPYCRHRTWHHPSAVCVQGTTGNLRTYKGRFIALPGDPGGYNNSEEAEYCADHGTPSRQRCPAVARSQTCRYGHAYYDGTEKCNDCDENEIALTDLELAYHSEILTLVSRGQLSKHTLRDLLVHARPRRMRRCGTTVSVHHHHDPILNSPLALNAVGSDQRLPVRLLNHAQHLSQFNCGSNATTIPLEVAL